jgi:6-phosphofructokinase
MRIALTTSGGDAPGLNSVIRGAVSAATRYGHEIFGIRNGFGGLLEQDQLVLLQDREVQGIERTGGTILGAASQGTPFGTAEELRPLIAALERHGIDALVIAGGDGSMQIAHRLAAAGLRVVGVPKTIDRDIPYTWTTFGFDTAVSTGTDAMDRLHSTAASHSRLMTIEVMGRDTGWIALYCGIGGGAHMIAIPELPYDVERFAAHLLAREEQGYRYHLLVASEGARPQGGQPYRSARTGQYGGVADALASELSERTGKEARSISLGHLLRGGPPTVFDRVLGLRFGSAAISALGRGESDVMIAFQPPGFKSIPLTEVAGRIQRVDTAAHEVRTALNLGIEFGTDASKLQSLGAVD